MLPACSTDHGRTDESSLSSSCALISVRLLVVLKISRGNINEFSMSPIDGLSPFAATSVVASALHISPSRFLNAMIVG